MTEAETERERIAAELEAAAINYYPKELAEFTMYHVAYIRSGLSLEAFCEHSMEEDHARAESPEGQGRYKQWVADQSAMTKA